MEKQGDGTPKQQAAGDKSDKSQSIVQKNYVVKGLVGKGTYGVVQKVRRIADGLICAMKETNVAHMSQVAPCELSQLVSPLHKQPAAAAAAAHSLVRIRSLLKAHTPLGFRKNEMKL